MTRRQGRGGKDLDEGGLMEQLVLLKRKGGRQVSFYAKRDLTKSLTGWRLENKRVGFFGRLRMKGEKKRSLSVSGARAKIPKPFLIPPIPSAIS